MRWANVVQLLTDDVVVAVETSKSRTRCWVRAKNMYTEIAVSQFKRLMQEGYIESKYTIEPNYAYKSELRIYQKSV